MCRCYIDTCLKSIQVLVFLPLLKLVRKSFQVLHLLMHLKPGVFTPLVHMHNHFFSFCLKSQRLSANPAPFNPHTSMQLFPLVIIYQIQSFPQTHTNPGIPKRLLKESLLNVATYLQSLLWGDVLPYFSLLYSVQRVFFEWVRLWYDFQDRSYILQTCLLQCGVSVCLCRLKHLLLVGFVSPALHGPLSLRMPGVQTIQMKSQKQSQCCSVKLLFVFTVIGKGLR